VDGHHWDGEVDIVGGARSDEHILYTLGKGSMVSVGAILGNTAHFASGRTRSGARLWVITRETMNRARRENPQAYDRVVARIGQRRADRIGLLPDTAFDMSASRPLLAPRTERDQLGCREVPGRAYFGVQTLRAVENFAISGVALRDFSHFIDPFAFVKKAAALAQRTQRLRTRARKRLARRRRARTSARARGDDQPANAERMRCYACRDSFTAKSRRRTSRCARG
jgi:aspartate ammonia-lyase